MALYRVTIAERIPLNDNPHSAYRMHKVGQVFMRDANKARAFAEHVGSFGTLEAMVDVQLRIGHKPAYVSVFEIDHVQDDLSAQIEDVKRNMKGGNVARIKRKLGTAEDLSDELI